MYLSYIRYSQINLIKFYTQCKQEWYTSQPHHPLAPLELSGCNDQHNDYRGVTRQNNEKPQQSSTHGADQRQNRSPDDQKNNRTTR